MTTKQNGNKKTESELNELTDLRSLEVSLVDRGANLKKRFPIFKSQNIGEENMNEEILKAVLETEVDEESDLVEYFEKAKVSDKGQNAVKAALRILNGYKEELPSDVIDKLAALVGYPAPKAKAAASCDTEEEKMKKKSKKMEDEDEYPSPEEKSKVKKEFDPEVSQILKSQEETIETIRAENERMASELKKERDERDLASWIAKAKEDLSHYPGKSFEQLGSELKALSDSNPELAKSHFETMKKASDALRTSPLLHESTAMFSKSLSGGNSAYDKIANMARSLVEKSSDSAFTFEKAFALVMEREKNLYNEYLAENPRQVR